MQFLYFKTGVSLVNRLKTNQQSLTQYQLCLTLCDCIVHGILQGRILEWVAFPFSRGSSQPRKDSESEWLAKDNLESNTITIKSETVSHVAEQFSWVPLPCCSPPRCPFTIKSLALSAHVSPRIIYFQVLVESPLLGPGRGPPPCNSLRYF